MVKVKSPPVQRTATVKSVIKAVNVLKTLSRGNRKLTEISRETKYSKSTVHRLLQALKASGMVYQDPISEEYHLGTVVFELASNPIVAHSALIFHARPRMEELQKFTGETITLDIKFGIEQIRLHQIIGTHQVTFLGAPSIIQLILPGASGKALLSQLPPSEAEEVIDSIELVKLTPYTITDKGLYKQEIAKARERGYATSHDEVEMGVAAVSVPVRNYSVPASITILGPKDRLAPHIMDFLDEIKSKASEISDALPLRTKEKNSNRPQTTNLTSQKD
jgi:IclR family acetate operon transcriptional repressor